MIAEVIASGGIDTKLAPLGILPQARKLRQEGGQAGVEALMPDEWIDQLAIVGTPADWHLAIRRLVDLGVHSVVLVPLPESDLDDVLTFAHHLNL